VTINLPASLFRLFCFLIFTSSYLDAKAETVELIIAADYIVTMDEKQTVIKNGAIAIDKGVIKAIGNRIAINRDFNAAEFIEGKNRVLMPGLINGHTHAAMTLFRGIADDLPLMEWLTKYIFPAEIRFVDPEFVRTGTQLACLEMIKGGTTTFVDMYFHPKEIAKVVEECGVRAVIGAAVIEQESGYTKNFDDAMNKAESYLSEWRTKNNRITPAIAAHAAYTISPDNLKIVRRQATRFGVPVAIHLSESKGELEIVKSLYNDTSINHLEKINFFSGPTIGAHVVWPTKDEISILLKRKVAVIHNPTSNMKIASGFAPVPEMIAAGVHLGLGTDGAASNNDLDMWEEIRLAAFIHKGRLLDPKSMPAATVLNMATSGGARAIGLGDKVGALIPGHRADLIQISLEAVHLVPLYDVISHLVYAVDAQDVQTVIVDGQILMRDRQVLTLNEAEVIKKAQAIATKINAEIRSSK
jgi:5-methylthioadenosine/S-adenosylhomocysteine deaminase